MRRARASTALLALAMSHCTPLRPPPWYRPEEWTPAPISFAGLRWRARQSDTPTGAGRNLWSAGPEHVRVDPAEGLVLRAARRAGRWYAAEVSTPLPDDYCRIAVEFDGAVGALDPGVVAAMFVYRNDQSEIDVEFTRWGEPAGPNAQFVVVPPTAPGHRYRFDAPPETARFVQVIDWRDGRVAFEHRADAAPPVVWTYRGHDVPIPGAHRLHINLWLRAEPALIDEATLTVRHVVVHRASDPG